MSRDDIAFVGALAYMILGLALLAIGIAALAGSAWVLIGLAIVCLAYGRRFMKQIGADHGRRG